MATLLIPGVGLVDATTTVLLPGGLVEIEGVTYQYARPASDVTDGNWYNESASQTDLYASIDEESYSDSDYIWTGATGSPVTIALGSLSDPSSSDNHVVRYRAKGNGSTDLQVTLLQDTTQIAQWTETNVPTDWTAYEHTLSGAQADSITNYGLLRLKFDAQ